MNKLKIIANFLLKSWITIKKFAKYVLKDWRENYTETAESAQ